MATTTITFRDCADKIFQSWTVLKLSIEQGFGGIHSVEKGQWIIDATYQWFSENANLERYEVEDFLSDILSEEFDTVADDGSLPEVSANLCKCQSLLSQKNYDAVSVLLSQLQEATLEKCVRDEKQEGSDSDSEEEEDCKMELSHNSVPQPTEGACNFSEQQPLPSTDPSDTHLVNGEKQDDEKEMEEDDGWTVVKKAKKR